MIIIDHALWFMLIGEGYGNSKDLIFGVFGQEWTYIGQNRYNNHFLIFFITERVLKGALKCPKSAQFMPICPILTFRAGDSIFIV